MSEAAAQATNISDSSSKPEPDRLWVRLIAPFSTLRTARLQTLATLAYPGPDGIKIQFRHSFNEERDPEEYSGFHDCIGIASTHYPVPRKARDALLSGTVVPQTYGDEEEAWDLESIPNTVMEMVRTVAPKLRGALSRTYGVLRWRYSHPGGAYPFERDYLEWSEDGHDWKDLPPDGFRPYEWDMFELNFSDEQAGEVEGLLRRDFQEPVAHALFREAWGQRYENTRSAIVIGMAAAETGLKAFIAKRLPEAAWLVTETPSPDLLKMLTSFVPTLLSDPAAAVLFSTRKDRSGYQDDVLRALQNGVTLRNGIVHKPNAGESPSISTVVDTLEAVRDLLYLLDYYGTHTWAEANIRSEVQKAWRGK